MTTPHPYDAHIVGDDPEARQWIARIAAWREIDAALVGERGLKWWQFIARVQDWRSRRRIARYHKAISVLPPWRK